jgi:ABC-type transport system involved in multi-copper enzyme maturation permease subunit
VRQTAAIFLDAYRELNAKKLFWITMILSSVLVLAFAATGINEKGLTFLHWTIDLPVMNTKVIPREDFYKYAFVTLGLGTWLTWGAMILALISTASIFPDFLAGGAIELSLSKPIGRVRLFLTKYAAALTFVALQVLVFTGASFLVIGVRGGAWEPGLFLAVPIVLLVFSFLYCTCVLFGVVTRSTIASLMLTMLVWFLIFVINAADAGLLQFRIQSEVRKEMRGTTIARLERDIEALGTAPESAEEVEAKTERLEKMRTEQKEAEENKVLPRVHDSIVAVKTLLPKTGETVDLMNRWLISEANLEKFAGPSAEEEAPEPPAAAGKGPERRRDPFERNVAREAGRRFQKQLRDRSVVWVLGTSIVFEVIVLGIAAGLFARRDF